MADFGSASSMKVMVETTARRKENAVLLQEA